MRFKRIAFAKIAWGETYTGEEVVGRFSYLKGRQGAGHERYNFKLGPAGRYYGYLPPIGPQHAAPRPEPPDGWLVIFVSAEDGWGPLRPVGWYEDATFEEEWKPRPEYPRFLLDKDGGQYSWAVSARCGNVHLISVPERKAFRVWGSPHLGKTPILYAAGGSRNEPWRKAYAKLAERIVARCASEAAPSDTGNGFPDPATARKVERRSVSAVRDFLRRRGFDTIRSCERACCGYDLFAASSKPKRELLVEVKGTQGGLPWFRLTRNERRSAELDPRWRLAMVTRALDAAVVELMNWTNVGRRFRLDPVIWEGQPK
ncbi:MAG: protein NO VEIN domain-containing protein [Bryobacteraceae bacterium]